MVEMASKVAHDNPLLYLGGATLLGFAASRFAKASRDHAGEDRQADKGSQVNSQMNEGNPNAQSMPASIAAMGVALVVVISGAGAGCRYWRSAAAFADRG